MTEVVHEYRLTEGLSFDSPSFKGGLTFSDEKEEVGGEESTEEGREEVFE